MIGTVTSISGSTVSVEVRDSEGVTTLHDVMVQQPMPGAKMLPPIGTSCRIMSEGAEYVVTGYLINEDPESQQQFSDEQLMGGDFCITSPEGAVLGFYKGGLLVMKANPATGFSVSESGVVNMFGKVIGILNSTFNTIIQDMPGGCQAEMSAFRSIDGAAVVETKFDAGLGKLETRLNYLKTLKVTINKEHLTLPIEGGTDLEFELVAANGKKFKATVDPLTANTLIKTEGVMAVDGETIVLGDPTKPLSGLVTGSTPCAAGPPGHVGCSKKVFAEIVV
ncbi:MAG: hypothetical protein WC455_09875 [Dehalococcoidia bacterium]|jgi:hypothetical protein